MAPRPVNNGIYGELGERWYEADDDPVALLRAEARLHAPWIARHLEPALGARGSGRILDVGCGAGFVANSLARRGLDVVGLDVEPHALAVAARHDETGRVRWVEGDGRALPFAGASFDAVCAMDFLEHVQPVSSVVAEIARVLRPGGLFFFHTFDRTFLSWLVVIKGVEWFVRNVPRDMHVRAAFVKPCELRAICRDHGLSVREILGCTPALSPDFFRMIATGVVPKTFAFRFRRRARTGFSGIAEKRAGR